MSFRYAGAFSGLGMLELACERLGGEPVFMCEADPFCQRVLRKRFPGVPLIEDVRDLRGSDYQGAVDVFVFGFPCQDISSAGRQKGIRAQRSGLWSEGFRVLSEMRPKIALIENVANLRNKGLDVVLHDLDSISYDAEWDIIPAAAVGAPHLRERIWIVGRPRELAQRPVYGEVARDKKGEVKTFSLVGKKPRAGRMTEDGCYELVPLAPRKTKRRDGWSYWVGVNLFAANGSPSLRPTPQSRDHMPPHSAEYIAKHRANGHGMSNLSDAVTTDPRFLWPSSSSRDYKDTGDLNCVPENGLLPRRVFRVEEGSALVPTPCANDDNRSPEAHMHMKRTKIPGGPRESITSLSVLARNDFHQANGRLWPTLHGTPREEYNRRQGPSGNELGRAVNSEERRLFPTTTTDAAGARNETAARPGGGRYAPGTTLTDALVKDGDLEVVGDGTSNRVVPARRREGAINLDGSSRGDGVVEVVTAGRVGETLGLGAAGVSEAAGGGRPASLFPTPSAASGSQGPGNSGRAGGENLVTRVNGSLSPTWTEWLMGIPLWWSDPTVHNAFVTQTWWDQEPLHVAPRVAAGVPMRSQRLKAVGNSVCWPCAYFALSLALFATPEVAREETSEHRLVATA